MFITSEKREIIFASLIEKDITDSRKFWHAVKPFLSNKIKSRENVILLNNDKITYNEVVVANILNIFISKIKKNLKIPEYYVEDKLPHSLSRHPTSKAILKY